MKPIRERTVVVRERSSGGRCRRHGCTEPVYSRELCRSDYQVASRLVRDELTTWPKLEREGKCAPTRPTAKEFFLGVA
jgi:hypothetical protein